MASFLSLSRPIDRKWFAGFSNYPTVGKLMAGSCSSAEICRNRFNSSFYPKGMRTLAEPILSPSSIQNPSFSSSSPCLMLPPAFDVDVSGAASINYKFYSLTDNKIITLSTEKSNKEREELTMWFRGSSHGWLALMCPRSRDLSLYNPISRRHIHLPSLGDLPNYPPNLPWADKVILTCSPDEDGPNCRAVMIYNNMRGLAFCCPGLSKEWTRIGDHHWFDEDVGWAVSNGSYMDCVYSPRHEALFSLTQHGVLDSWDLRDPQSPRAVKIGEVVSLSHKRARLGYPRTEEEEKKLRVMDETREHLVVAGQDLLVVTQYVVHSFDFDGLYVDSRDPNNLAYERGLPGVTIDFDVHKYDPEDMDVKYVEGSSLGGWALFVGLHSDAVALPAADFPELNPNSIYFTDAQEDSIIEDFPTGGHDIGIFNYENKTVLPCYFPCDAKNLRKTFPAPMWFFPSRE
ncbi:Protein of unknown function (DUF295 [Striga hermonthica]|uniref:KIB1-4 beta-propeller domain-containing protein n=1 Tax=Striga hermonthica TaxID=68872 RepID=A0A9N7RLD3_STRHE|nr:Protein of unknown function (DUF295 [Striga hermonthica]